MIGVLSILLSVIVFAAAVQHKPKPLAETDSPVGERAIPNSAIWYYNDPHLGVIKYTVNTNPSRTLNDSKAYCEALGHGTQLASVETAGQLAFLQSKLKPFVAGIATKDTNRAAFWVAGTDLVINSVRGEGQYWFYSGRDINTAFWNINEPNNYQSGQGRDPETCIDLKVPKVNASAPFGVNDEVCTSLLSLICQHPGQCKRCHG